MGPLLYDMDRVAEAANADDHDLVRAQRDIILDPSDPEVIAAARQEGISESWLEACRRSPVYKMFVEWEIALPLHPEFRTLPCLFYVPPESPLRTAATDSASIDMVGGGSDGSVLPDLDQFRIPMQYVARLLSAGNEAEVRKALSRLLAMRVYRRSIRVEGAADLGVLSEVGLSEKQVIAMHRLLALAHFHERFAVPTTHREETANAPYIERGFTGFGELTPSSSPRRRSSFHGEKAEVGS
jgi:nitrate reductase beta subunit